MKVAMSMNIDVFYLILQVELPFYSMQIQSADSK